MASTPQSSPGDTPSITPYRIHVSQKYLEITRKKLELVRLPREIRSLYRAHRTDTGVSKSNLEPLIDHWLEEYDWRSQETILNDKLPQFRAQVLGTRLHVVHKTSISPNAIPLLFIHGWPDSFITVSSVIEELCEPFASSDEHAAHSPAFHVVAPTISGFGFSDAVKEEGNNIVTTAETYDALMKQLGYLYYIVHGADWGFKIARTIALQHPESCMAVHTVNPEMPAPNNDPSWWPGSNVISPMLDPAALNLPNMAQPSRPPTKLDNPQTIAYALCDSPSGLLAYLMELIMPPVLTSPSTTTPSPHRSPHSRDTSLSNASSETLNPWSSTHLINWVMLHWLPGPEIALRWLANSSAMESSLWLAQSHVPLGITQYTTQPTPGTPLCGPGPPAWAEAYHRVAMIRRRVGTVRCAVWERPEDIIADIRELAMLVY